MTAPSAAPTKKVSFPEKGKTMTIIVPWPAGGGIDVMTRLLAPILEKELGIPVQVVNKGGATSQVGLTELARSAPDGYTLVYTNLPDANATYLDPDRKAIYSRKDLQPVALHSSDPGVMFVKADGPYKSVKDLVDAAKANPGGVKVGTAGALGQTHLALLELQRQSGAKFATVHFEGGPPNLTAVIGGHTDAASSAVGTGQSQLKAGTVRPIGVMADKESIYAPGAKTMLAEGFDIKLSSERGLIAPGGTPREIVDILNQIVRKATEDPDHRSKVAEMRLELKYMSTSQYEAYWDQFDALVGPLIALAKKDQ